MWESIIPLSLKNKVNKFCENDIMSKRLDPFNWLMFQIIFPDNWFLLLVFNQHIFLWGTNWRSTESIDNLMLYSSSRNFLSFYIDILSFQ